MATTYAIPDGRTVMAATTYTGTGATQTISNAVNGVSFQPDFVWAKRRNTSVASHGLVDSVRGTGKTLFSNLTDPEDTGDSNLTAFNSNGFTAGSGGNFNASGPTYVGWQWKGGGTASTIAIGSISSGVPSIASSVSANTAAGFSVVTYTGTGAAATIGHGLGAVPSMIILFPRNNTGYAQPVWHTSLGGSTDSDYLVISNAGGRNYAGALTGLWNNTAPTNSVFSIGTSVYSNTSAKNYVAYCFAAVPGYSAFGSYTGNNDANGPFVYLGFRPRWIMFKDSSTTGAWIIMDSSREIYNVEQTGLAPNSSNSESSYSGTPQVDFLSNGFKIRATNANSYWNNVSGNTYIYAAFAENPFKYANAR
jgi:hypothetical protein